MSLQNDLAQTIKWVEEGCPDDPVEPGCSFGLLLNTLAWAKREDAALRAEVERLNSVLKGEISACDTNKRGKVTAEAEVKRLREALECAADAEAIRRADCKLTNGDILDRWGVRTTQLEALADEKRRAALKP